MFWCPSHAITIYCSHLGVPFCFRQELQALRKDNAGLDSNCHEQDKIVTHLKTRVAVLEQEVQDKEELKRKTNELYATEQDQKVCRV